MNNYELNEKAQEMADSVSPYALARHLIEERQTTARLCQLVADIRDAAGVGGKLMQDELVDHIADLSKKVTNPTHTHRENGDQQ